MSEKKTDIREVLNQEFEKLKLQYGSYSLRRFAKKLSVDASLLSKILKGTRPASKAFILRVQKALDLPPAILSQFDSESLDGVESSSSLGARVWFLPILFEYIKTSGPTCDLDGLCGQLGVSSNELEMGLNYLVENQIIEPVPPGYRVLTEAHHFITDLPREELIRYHEYVVGFWKESITSARVSERLNMSVSVAMDQTDVDIVQSEISRFGQRIQKILGGEGRPKTHIYQMLVGFFPAAKL